MVARPAAMLLALCLAVGGHAALLYGLAAAQPPQTRGVLGSGGHNVRGALPVQVLTPPENARRGVATPAGHRGGTARAQPPVQPTTPAAPGADTGERGRYFAASEVDRPALPRSSPDPAMLDGTAPSGLPIRLRLYISAAGEVTEVEALSAYEDDLPAVQRLREMFLATAFVAAKRNGREVPSYMDIDVDFLEVGLPASTPSTTVVAQP